jgi:hypothetical protein
LPNGQYGGRSEERDLTKCLEFALALISGRDP